MPTNYMRFSDDASPDPHLTLRDDCAYCMLDMRAADVRVGTTRINGFIIWLFDGICIMGNTHLCMDTEGGCENKQILKRSTKAVVSVLL